MNLKVLIAENERSMGLEAANLIAEEIRTNPKAVLSLSTGATPIGCYRELVRLYAEGTLDFRCVKAFSMDEYIGLSRDHPQSFYQFMYQHLYRHVNLDPSRIFSPDALNQNLPQAAAAFDARMEQEGGFDLILLGIGRDGHIAFNMPECELKLLTHVQKLSAETIKDNAKFFDNIGQVPDKALTVGIKNILDSKKVVLIANGEAKSNIIEQFLHSDTINPNIPSTLLKLHSNVTVIIDKAAAKKL